MKSVAVLLDIGFLNHALGSRLESRKPTSDETVAFARACVGADEELFRIFAYHCPPYDGVHQHPITREKVDFSSSQQNAQMRDFIDDLATQDGVAFRAGELSFRGWQITKWAAKRLIRGRDTTIEERHLKPEFSQKRVDMKIGLDVAWLASKRLVDRILLVTADSDFIPAMKFARREGTQVVLIPMEQPMKRELRMHADEVRSVAFPR